MPAGIAMLTFSLSLSLFILIHNHLYIYDSHIPNAVADSESNGSAGNGLAL